MDQFIQRLTDLLTEHFANAEVDLGPASGDRVSGFLIWEGFQEDEQIDRQRAVWRVLRAELPPDELLRVAAVFTLTPQEMSAARAG
jgi:hypothetical protein